MQTNYKVIAIRMGPLLGKFPNKFKAQLNSTLLRQHMLFMFMLMR